MRSSIDSITEQDQTFPFLRQVIVLDVKGAHIAVVTDCYNKCLKSFQNEACHSRLQLNHVPWGIDQLGDNQLLVAVPGSNQVVRVKVTPDLVHVAHINTHRKYYSLVVMPHSRIAAGADNLVDILNMQGEVIKSVSSHNNMKLFKYPYFMCVNNTGHLLVSDWGKRTVTCLTSEGHVYWVYSSSWLGKPTGITTTNGGDILVSDSDWHSVIQLNETGGYLRKVLNSQDGLRYPDGICLDKHSTLYTCQQGQLLKYKI